MAERLTSLETESKATQAALGKVHLQLETLTKAVGAQTRESSTMMKEMRELLAMFSED